MNQLLDNKIRKIEYISFIKKIKEKIFIKNQIKAKIILFQKRFAIEQLLINVINEMKNKLLNDKLKHFLVQKFLYTIMAQYIEHYQNENDNGYPHNYKSDKIQKINRSKQIFNDYFIKNNIYSFLNGANICINNSRLKTIQYNFLMKNRINEIKIYFMKFKQLKNYSFSNHKKIIIYKIFFIKVKYNHNNKKQSINIISDLQNRKKKFISKNIFHRFISNCKENKNIKNSLKYEDNKDNKENIKNININIAKFRKKLTAKYFKLFVCRIKIIKQANDSLKRKIFNLIKNNVKISKDLKYYLSEANGMQ